MPIKRVSRFACILVFASLAANLFAAQLFYDRFVAFYKPDPQSALGKAECKTCHSLDNGPPVRNVFGRRLEGLINHANDGTMRGGVNQDTLIFVEKEDADQDGYTNLEEIVSGTLPGDPASKPAQHPTNLPVHVMSRKIEPLHLEVTGAFLLIGLLMSGGGKAAKKPNLSRLGLGVSGLGVLAAVATFIVWFLSNRHP